MSSSAPVGDDLVGIHVGRGSCSALDHIDRELVKMLSVYEFAASLRDSLVLLICKQIKFMVGHGCPELGDAYDL